MRILFVTSYPPPFDARTRAATAHVGALRAEGNEVEVLSPEPSAAHHHDTLGSWRSLARLARRFRGFDRVVVSDDLLATPPLQRALRAARSVETWTAPVAPPRVAVEPAAVWSDDRDAAMAEIRARAARRPVADAGSATADDLAARMRRVPPLVLPDSASTRPGASTVQRIVRRLTRWQVDPIVARVNQMRATLIDEFETLERRDDR